MKNIISKIYDKKPVAGKSIRGVRVGLMAVLVSLSVSGCIERYSTRGNLPNPDLLAEMKPGDITRDEVSEILGSPSAVATFDKEKWFYISETTKTIAFLEPEVTDRKVVIMTFDKDGTLNDVRTLGLEDARKVTPVDRKTPTAGNELTIIEQLIGNFNRFRRKPKSE